MSAYEERLAAQRAEHFHPAEGWDDERAQRAAAKGWGIAGSFAYQGPPGPPAKTPPASWHHLRGAEYVAARSAVIAAAKARDPSGDSWTGEENRAADEEQEALEAQEPQVAQALAHVPDADDCARCVEPIGRLVEGPVCRRCAIRLAGLVLVSCLSPITPSRQKETA